MTTKGEPMKKALIGAVALLALAACGDDDDDATAEETSAAAETDADASAAPTTHDMGDDMTVTVDAVDYAFEGLPATVPVGTKLTLVNKSSVELHEMVILPVPAGETRTIGQLLALPEAELDAIFGTAEPAAVIIAPPDGAEPIMAVGDGTLTTAGRYVVICSIPKGADPAEFLAAMQTESTGPPSVEGGPPHFLEGMYADLTVE